MLLSLAHGKDPFTPVELSAFGLSLGDATTKNVAEFCAETGADVVIVTGDQGLETHEPTLPPKIPRRRRCGSSEAENRAGNAQESCHAQAGG
jgi:hypothetical protein